MMPTTMRVTHIDARGRCHKCLLRNVQSLAAAIRHVEQVWGEASGMSLIWLRGM